MSPEDAPIMVPIVVSIGASGGAEMGVSVGVRMVGGEREGEGVMVMDEGHLTRGIAEALLLLAATMLDARGDELGDVVGLALDVFDEHSSDH